MEVKKYFAPLSSYLNHCYNKLIKNDLVQTPQVNYNYRGKSNEEQRPDPNIPENIYV